MARSSNCTSSSPRKRFLLSTAAAAVLAAAATATGASADIIARPPFFVPQRADNLILSGGRDAGDWETLSALRDAGLPCYGNMCEKKGAEASASAMGEFGKGLEKKNGFGRGASSEADLLLLFAELHLRLSGSILRLNEKMKVIFDQRRDR